MLSSILNKMILSHLIVAVPPAVVLGVMVSRINESALRYEAQLLHLSTANRMKEALADQVADAVTQLEHAERVLALEALPFEERQNVLRALIASGAIPHLLVFRADGAFDASVHVDADGVPKDALEPTVIARAKARGFGLGPPRPDHRTVVAVPWEQGSKLIGFLGTTLDPSTLESEAKALAATYLGPLGQVEVIDRQGRRVLGAGPSPTATGLAGTAFEGLALSTDAEGLTTLAAGISKSFVDQAGETRLAAVVSDPELGWIVGTSRPVKVAFESLARVRQRVLLISLAAALAAGLVGLLLARQLSQPINTLITAVRRSARVGFSEGTTVEAKGELGQLAGAFNTAITELTRYRTDLQQTTQLRLRLSRLVSSAAVHEALAGSETGEAEPPQVVTVVYADVVLPNDRALNTEHLVTVLGEFFGAAHDTLRRHHGTVDRFSGDAVIGIFVGPNPKGAFSAARELVANARAVSARWEELLGSPLSASAGIVTAEGRLSRTAESQELSVSGPMVERAAVAQSRAAAGVILMDAATHEGAEAPGASTTVDGPGKDPWFSVST